MPRKCEFCGEKVKDGVCTGCGMDYNRTSYADTANEHSEGSRKASDNAEMFGKAMIKGTKTAQRRTKTITIVLLSIFLIIITVCAALINTSEDAKRAADRKAEQAITERPRLSIPEISIPKVNIPRVTIPEVVFDDEIKRAIEHDIQAIIEQNGKEKE